MSTWYIDPENGSDAADGRSEDFPRRSWEGLEIRPGDRVLLRRGTILRGCIQSPDGLPGQPIVWGAYGEGQNPVICGSASHSAPEGWRQLSETIWEAVGLPRDEVCSIVFDGGASFGTLRWTEEALCEEGDWFFSHFDCEGVLPDEPVRLLLCCRENPGRRWRDIEVVLYGHRHLAAAEHDVVFQDLTFMNSGVHGVACVEAERISVLRCRFERIGGAVWSRERRIRFGNGVEFWRKARDIRVEDCSFSEIYDSCVTHQGSGDYPVPERITIQSNTFSRYGMAAYEVRDVIPREAVFAGNRCSEAGMGFSMQGEDPPRNSEIWPQPMGHHIFAWRIETPTPGGSIVFRENRFGSVACGSAEYSILAPEAEAQLLFSDNHFSTGRGERALYRCGAYGAAEGDC